MKEGKSDHVGSEIKRRDMVDVGEICHTDKCTAPFFPTLTFVVDPLSALVVGLGLTP